MKRAVILHGTDDTPDGLWLGWLRSQLRARDFDVLAPDLPGKHTPDRNVYNEFLLGQEWDYTNNLMIGHSSGAAAIFNLLLDNRSPSIDTAVLVAGFTEMSEGVRRASWYDEGQFNNTFPLEGFDWEKIFKKCKKFYFVHGDDDPYCPYELAAEICQRLQGTLITIPGGGHLSSSSGITELPEIIEKLESDGVL